MYSDSCIQIPVFRQLYQLYSDSCTNCTQTAVPTVFRQLYQLSAIPHHQHCQQQYKLTPPPKTKRGFAVSTLTAMSTPTDRDTKLHYLCLPTTMSTPMARHNKVLLPLLSNTIFVSQQQCQPPQPDTTRFHCFCLPELPLSPNSNVNSHS